MIKKLLTLLFLTGGSAFGFSNQYYVQNSNSLQAGTTIYLSSGTIQNFTATQSTSTNLTSTNIVGSTLTLSGNIVGATPGAAVPAGYVGEVITAYGNVGGVPTAGNVGIATATLTTGYWYVSGTFCNDNNGTQTGFNAYFYQKGVLSPNLQGNDNMQVRMTAGLSACASFGGRSLLVLPSDANKTVSIWATSVTATETGFGYISAIRYK